MRSVAVTGPNGTVKAPYTGELCRINTQGDRGLRVELYGDKQGQYDQLLAVSSPIYFA